VAGKTVCFLSESPVERGLEFEKTELLSAIQVGALAINGDGNVNQLNLFRN